MITREAVPNDAEALLEIYAPYVKDTAICRFVNDVLQNF